MKAPASGGRIVLDGLVEGPVPPRDDGEDALRAWVRGVEEAGLGFSLSIEGGGFSLLADARPREAGPYEDFPAGVQAALGSLLDLYPRELRGRIFSTLRSVERREGIERQVVYLVTPRGVEIRERKVPAREEAEPRRRVPVLPLIAGAIGIAGILAASTLVIDYRALLESATSLDPARIAVDASPAAAYLSVSTIGTDRSKIRLVLEVRRTPRYPTTVAAFRAEEARLREGNKLEDLLAFERIVVAGRVRIEYLDREGELLGFTHESIRDLQSREAVPIEVRVRAFPGTAKVRVLD